MCFNMSSKVPSCAVISITWLVNALVSWFLSEKMVNKQLSSGNRKSSVYWINLRPLKWTVVATLDCSHGRTMNCWTCLIHHGALPKINFHSYLIGYPQWHTLHQPTTLKMELNSINWQEQTFLRVCLDARSTQFWIITQVRNHLKYCIFTLDAILW